MAWGFYGRKTELEQLSKILGRKRWFFGKVTGRRRIGKTTLIQQALQNGGRTQAFYIQIPDSSPAGVLSAVADHMDTFQFAPAEFPRPKSLLEFAKMISLMVEKGVVVTLDEFQYFNRQSLQDFCSFLQAEVDQLAAKAEKISGGLFVLGSIQTEMTALLEDRSAPLYNRVTDEVELSHLDIGSVLEIPKAHATTNPHHFLFLWTLFEGVPKFYRDCYEQEILSAPRDKILKRLFFESSSPLKTEADNWFLKELHGRYDAILKYVSRNAGCNHSDLVNHMRAVSSETSEQVGGYLQVLIEKYRIIEKKLPVFAKPSARSGRYYITDNFLRAWLGALAAPVSAINFSPVDRLIRQADDRLQALEGLSLEKLSGILYQERSRKGVGDFSLTSSITGYWDRAGIEIDLVAIDDSNKRMRLGSCKRSAERLLQGGATFRTHIQRFLEQFGVYKGWAIEPICIAPEISASTRRSLKEKGFLPQDLNDLFAGL